MIKVHNLFFQVKKETLLKNICLEIDKGEVCCILGSNGAGKSTLLKTILGQHKRYEGEIVIAGEVLNPNSRIGILSKVGVLLEQVGAYNHLTAFENLKIICLYHNLGYDIIDEVLEITNLSSDKHKKITHFSSGMKQRLGLAMALVNSPEIIFLDEPTNTLDPQGIFDLRNLILKLNKSKNITFLINSHSVEEVKKIANHVIILNKGEIIYNEARTNFTDVDLEKILII